MNVVLFHMGIYNEKYYKNFPLYEKCYNRIIDEFSQDKIYIFHSLIEIFQTFSGFEEEYKKYQNFLCGANYNPVITNDLIRLLLSHYIEDYIYIDSDIYIFKGFKKYIQSKLNDSINLLAFDYGSTSICYIKKQFKELDQFINKIFNEKKYSYDCEMNNKFGLSQIKGVSCSLHGRDKEAHFYSLFTIRDHVKKILILSGPQNDTEKIAISLLKKYDCSVAIKTDSWMAFKDDKNSIKTYFFSKECEITLDDILNTCNNFGKKTYIKEFINIQ